MEVTIRPKNFKLQPNIETQVQKRVDRLTHHLENLESCEVILTQEPTRFNAQRVHYVAQLTLRTRNSNLIRSEVTDDDLLAAVDQAIDRLTRQIERFKDRCYQSKKGKQGIGRSSAQVVASHPQPTDPSDAVPAPAPPTRLSDGTQDEEDLGDIVRVKRFNMEPMYPEEAIEQMELLGHNFFVFYNAGEKRAQRPLPSQRRQLWPPTARAQLGRDDITSGSCVTAVQLPLTAPYRWIGLPSTQPPQAHPPRLWGCSSLAFNSTLTCSSATQPAGGVPSPARPSDLRPPFHLLALLSHPLSERRRAIRRTPHRVGVGVVRAVGIWWPVARSIGALLRTDQFAQTFWLLIAPLVPYLVLALTALDYLVNHAPQLDKTNVTISLIALFAVCLRNSWRLLFDVALERKNRREATD